MSALSRVGPCAGREHAIAGTLSYGHQRLLEVAMGLALKPRLLILDEPTQGLSDAEIDNFIGLVREIAREAHRAPDRAQHAGGDATGRPHHGDGCRDASSPRARRSRSAPMPSVQHAYLGTPWRTAPMADALSISGLDCFYGEAQVLHGLNSLDLQRGRSAVPARAQRRRQETTALKAIMGLVPARSGSIRLGERGTDGLPPHEVPTGRRRLCAAGPAAVRRDDSVAEKYRDRA